MADGADKKWTMPDPTGLMAQAAASWAATGLQKILGLVSGAQPEVSGSSWLERMLAPYEQALGALASVAPRVLERVGQVVDSAGGRQLLFRARSCPECAIDSLVRKPPRTLVTKALSERLEAIKKGSAYAGGKEALNTLVEDPQRTDLPRLLDELKHEVRADRINGFVRVHDKLKWLLEKSDNGKSLSDGYALLEKLSDNLGETCLDELRRRRCEGALLTAGSGDDTWLQPLTGCFAKFGHQLSDLVSVVACGPQGDELLVMDHGQDRWFEIRNHDGSSGAGTWTEVYGAEAGRDYVVGKQRYKLPLRDHDASHGFATWSVDCRRVQESPDCFSVKSQPDVRAWDTGGNRTPVALFFVHHRDTDAGEYYELGLGCFVAPRKDPLSVGVATLGTILVSTEEGRNVGHAIWGYRKEHVKRSAWLVGYRPDQLECSVDLGDAAVTLRLPRGGGSLVSALPMLLYTCKPADGEGQWHRSPLMRFARGESVRTAGSGVLLSVEVRDQKALAHPFLKELYRLGLVDQGGRMRSHALHAGWSEHVSTQIGAPTPVPLPEAESG